ncbi:MAG: putative metal-binding motif-containing protein [Myxococcales bacterium]|nr:putative metal-binding motif-containing protein [Myxococcales bacterium]
MNAHLIALLTLFACRQPPETLPDAPTPVPVDQDQDGATLGEDCDDADPTRFPGAEEICDGVDNDCDGLLDEDRTIWFVDDDADGFGSHTLAQESCAQPAGFVAISGDCDDSDPDVAPGADERCDGIDNDCDGQIDARRVPTDFATLQQAVNVVDDHATICLEPGEITGAVDVSGRTLTVVSSHGAQATTWRLTDGKTAALSATGPGLVTVRGITISGLDTEPLADLTQAGTFARAREDAHVVLEDVIFEDLRLAVTDEGRVIGGVLSVADARLELLHSDVRDLTFSWLNTPGPGQPRILGGFLYASFDADVTLEDVDIDGLNLTTDLGTRRCDTTGLFAASVGARFEAIDVQVSGTSIVQDCVDISRVQGAVLDLSASTDVLLDGLDIVDVDVDVGGDSAYLRGLVRLDSARGDIYAASVVDSWLQADGEVIGGFYLIRPQSLPVEHLTATGNVLVAEGISAGASGAALTVEGGGAEVRWLDVRGNVTFGDARSLAPVNLAGFGTSVDVTNAIIVGNVTGHAGTDVVEGGALRVAEVNRSRLAHLDVVGNTAAGRVVHGAGIWIDDDSFELEISHSSFVDNLVAGSLQADGAVVARLGSPDEITWIHNNVWGNLATLQGTDFVGLSDPTTTGGNLAADPAYTDVGTSSPLSWSLVLAKGSPLIDAGDPDNSDVDGSIADLGAYGGPDGGW